MVLCLSSYFFLFQESAYVCIWVLRFVLHISLFYRPTPPPWETDFQINPLKVNCQEIKPVSDKIFYEFLDRNVARVCGKQEFPRYRCGNEIVSSDTPPGNQVCRCQREAWGRDNDRGLKGPHLDRLSSRLLVWCTRTLAAKEFRVCLSYIR